MKNVSTKLVAGAAVMGIAGIVHSFSAANEPNEAKNKKYEVIRMVDGQLTEHDTTVALNSNYSPEDYLNDLGYGEDKNVKIIDFQNPKLLDLNVNERNQRAAGEAKIVKIQVDAKNLHEVNREGEDQNAFVEKRSIKTGKENDLDIEAILDEINLDSIIEAAKGEFDGDWEKEKLITVREEIVMKEDGEGEGVKIKTLHLADPNGDEEVISEMYNQEFHSKMFVDSLADMMEQLFDGDSGKIVMRKLYSIDEEYEGEDGMNWHEINPEGADYHKEVIGPDHDMKIAVWCNSEEDFTLVIVSDPENSPNGRALQGSGNMGNDFKLYPNPASTVSQLQLNFLESAPTMVTITDINGRISSKMEFGSFSGQFNHDIDVEKWSKGVYIIQVDHGNEKMLEKLIVE